MLQLRWQGAPPEPVWRNELKARGVVVSAQDDASALTVVRTIAKESPKPNVGSTWLWLSAQAPSLEQERRAILAGAVDVLSASDPRLVDKLVARLELVNAPDTPLPEGSGFVAHSRQARRLLAEVRRAARTSMPVLITGETGTGKELTARLIHTWSRRRDKLFVPVFCAAIPNDLIEAELFGYVRGAFSGAVRDYDGLLAAAEGGTVFLDEIDDTPPTLQTKLLRVLEDRVVSQLGKNEWHRVDFRIVAATNRDLGALIARGEFGQDLYERLAILHLALPPLRERTEDLPALALHLIDRFYSEEPPDNGKERVVAVSERALSAMAEYGWPGNVRELRNIIYESLVRKSFGQELTLADLPPRILKRGAGKQLDALVDAARLTARFDTKTMNLRQELEQLERAAVLEALRRAQGNLAGAARLLGEVGRGTARDPAGTVRAMLKRLNITLE